MIDELHELRKLNQHDPDALAEGVAMSKEDLILALRADSSRFPFVSSLISRHRRQRSTAVPARWGWAGALAAVVLMIVALGQSGVPGGDTEVDVDVGEAPATGPNQLPESPTTTSIIGPVTSTVDSLSPTTDGNATSSTLDEPSAVAPTAPVTAPPSPSTAEAPPATVVPTTGPTSTVPRANEGPFTAGVDLLAVHLDFAHTDDGLSALATREVAEWFALDPLVVAGTASPEAFAHPYGEIMTSAWGPGWVDAATNRAAAVGLTSDLWLGVLDAGGDVWVAEGGVSDFSAEVIRSIRETRPGLDTTARIHVVQHAQRNEIETAPADLSYILANADYIRIDDGNNANDTADLNRASSEFETAALAGPRAAAWAMGFEYHTASQLDFSDTVGVLHILGIGTDQVANPEDFAVRFITLD